MSIYALSIAQGVPAGRKNKQILIYQLDKTKIIFTVMKGVVKQQQAG